MIEIFSEGYDSACVWTCDLRFVGDTTAFRDHGADQDGD
jgi:hypothetical protein